jgi:hypothetical protein
VTMISTARSTPKTRLESASSLFSLSKAYITQ